MLCSRLITELYNRAHGATIHGSITITAAHTQTPHRTNRLSDYCRNITQGPCDIYSVICHMAYNTYTLLYAIWVICSFNTELHIIKVSSFLLCCDTVGWVTGRAAGLEKNLAPAISKSSSSEDLSGADLTWSNLWIISVKGKEWKQQQQQLEHPRDTDQRRVSNYFLLYNNCVARWLGCWTCDQQVAGLNPLSSATLSKLLTLRCLCHQAA